MIFGATIGTSTAPACGPSQRSTEPRNEISNHSVNAPEIRNSDLTWDGTMLGLQPRIANPKTADLVDAPASLDGQLVELLRDPDRFAVAHVLLTIRRNALQSFDANQWNGLRVTLKASGAVRYDPADMAALYQRWSAVVRRAGREPARRRLPARRCRRARLSARVPRGRLLNDA